MRLLGTTGLRWGEAVALRRRRVDLLGRRLLVSESLAEVGGELIFGPTKSHAERDVPLTVSIAAALETHLDERVSTDLRALVFTSPKGHPLRYANFRREVWAPALTLAKIPRIGLHVLRHSAAAAMIRAGASPKALQALLGHQSAGFTLSVYGHVFEQDMAALAERLERVVTASSDNGDGKETRRRTVLDPSEQSDRLRPPAPTSFAAERVASEQSESGRPLHRDSAAGRRRRGPGQD